jgi:hypothetical protein
MLKVTDHKNLIQPTVAVPQSNTVFDIQKIINATQDKSFEVSLDLETNSVHFEIFVDGETLLIVLSGALAVHAGSWLMEVGSVANFLEKSDVVGVADES